MKDKSSSNKIAMGCIVALLLIVLWLKLAQCLHAQTPAFSTTLEAHGSDLYVDHAAFHYIPGSGYVYTPTIQIPVQKYRIDAAQAGIWSLYALSGVMNGCREAYHAQPTVFETRFRATSLSWWGSEQWRRNYRNNDPSQPHKTELMGNVGRDMWHTFGAGYRVTMQLGAFLNGARNLPMKHRIINAVIGYGIQMAASNITYNLLR